MVHLHFNLNRSTLNEQFDFVSLPCCGNVGINPGFGELLLGMIQAVGNRFQRRCSRRGVVRIHHVNVHGQTRHILNKQIDRGSAFHGEMRMRKNGWHAFQQKPDGINVGFVHHGLIFRRVPFLSRAVHRL